MSYKKDGTTIQELIEEILLLDLGSDQLLQQLVRAGTQEQGQST